MRLTLRTLLALRDGILQGAERDDLAAKVAASTVAPRLLERIADLGQRADLPTPDGNANTVAEFLDNVLAGEHLEAFERACLESEPHMAEAAECHTLLAELMRGPTGSQPLDSTHVERLLELIDRDKPSSARSAKEDDALDIGDIMRAAKAAAERPQSGPARQRPGASLGAWVSVGVAIVLLLVLGGLLVRSIWRPAGGSRQVAVDERLTSVPEKPVPLQPVAVPAPAAPDEPAVTEPASEPVHDASDAAAHIRGPDTPTESDASMEAEPSPPPSETVSPFPPQPDEQVIPLPVMEAESSEPAVAATVPEGPIATQPQADAEGPQLIAGGPLLHRVVTENDAVWHAASAGSKLSNTEEFLVPVHCYPQIARGNLSIVLLPGSRGMMTVDRDGELRIEIVFGQAVVWTEAAAASVGITAGGLSGRMSLGPRQPVGIDVELVRDRGTDPATVPPGMHATMIAVGGGRFRQTERDGGVPGVPLAGLEIEQALPPRGGIVWDSVAPRAARVVPIAREPSWMKLIGPVRIVDRHASKAMAMALAADMPAEAALRTMSESRRVEERMAAAATLALLGDFDCLVDLLCEESPDRKLREGEWTALEAMTVPLALARGANAASALRKSFAKKGPPGRGDELYVMARGLTAEELAAGGGGALVNALEDSALVVRRYALENLVALLPDSSEATRDYRPDRAKLLNERGLAWWRARLAEGLGSGEADPTETP